MTIPFFKKLYKAFSLGTCLITHVHALSPEQELKLCKSALLAQINEQQLMQAERCPVTQKLLPWLGILRDPEQFTPKELIEFIMTHTHWPHHEKLCQKAEDTITKKGSPEEILVWFGKYPPQTPKGIILYGKTLLVRKEKTKAAKIIAKAWQMMEMTASEEKNFLKHFGHFLQGKDYIERLNVLLWNENIEDAKRVLPYVPDVVRKLAAVRISFLEGKSDVLQKMKALPLKYQKNEAILYEKARWHRKRKEFQEAAEILCSHSSKGTYAQKWWKERNYIARELIALRDYQTAYQISKKHGLAPGNEDFANAEWLSGWLAFRFLDRPKEAQRHFKTLSGHVKGAISKARGAYWIGRVNEQQGEIALAEKAYRKAAKYKTIFYGQLAAAKLREKPYPILATHSKITLQEQKLFEQKDLVKAAYILKGLGEAGSHELSKFLLHIADQAKTKGEKELAVHLAHKLSPHDVVWTAKKAGYTDPILLKNAFPIHAIPRKGQDLPEESLVLAVAYQESRFIPTAESSAGAMGLMQLLPSTAAQEAKQLGIKHTEKKLFNPEHNLLLGSSYLSRLLKEFNDSYILGLAAYNAGPSPVRRWLEELGDPHVGNIDVIDWIELIPYAQTRDYVMRVLEIITIYRSLKGTPRKTLIEDLKGI